MHKDWSYCVHCAMVLVGMATVQSVGNLEVSEHQHAPPSARHFGSGRTQESHCVCDHALHA